VMSRDGNSRVLADTIDGQPVGKVNFVLRDSKDRIWVTVSTKVRNWMLALPLPGRFPCPLTSPRPSPEFSPAAGAAGDVAIRRKMAFSFEHPLRSRIFTAEMMRGAPVLNTIMDTSKQHTDQAAAVIQNWMDQGLMDKADPMLVLFHIWAVTQFYADHATQAAYFRNVAQQGDDKDRRYLIEQVTEFLLKGAGVK